MLLIYVHTYILLIGSNLNKKYNSRIKNGTEHIYQIY